MWSYGGAPYVFWESNRDGDWNIYYSYRDIVGIEPEEEVHIPQELSLSAYPNPFNATTVVSFELRIAGEVEVGIFDVFGRDVGALLRAQHAAPLQDAKWYPAGRHEVAFDAAGLASGVYLVRVESQHLVQTEKLVLLK
jgi:hypothetical protein